MFKFATSIIVCIHFTRVHEKYFKKTHLFLISLILKENSENKYICNAILVFNQFILHFKKECNCFLLYLFKYSTSRLNLILLSKYLPCTNTFFPFMLLSNPKHYFVKCIDIFSFKHDVYFLWFINTPISNTLIIFRNRSSFNPSGSLSPFPWSLEYEVHWKR